MDGEIGTWMTFGPDTFDEWDEDDGPATQSNHLNSWSSSIIVMLLGFSGENDGTQIALELTIFRETESGDDNVDNENDTLV